MPSITNPESKIGMTAYNHYGELMTIVAYTKSNDFWIEFEDKSRVHCRNIGNFTGGKVVSPKRRKQNQAIRSKQQADAAKDQHIGEVFRANNGLQMKVIGYVNNTDVSIEFEDGQRVFHRLFSNVKLGAVGHPSQTSAASQIRTCGFTLKGLAYIYNEVGNFYCKCDNCGLVDIMSISEMKSHKCIEP